MKDWRVMSVAIISAVLLVQGCVHASDVNGKVPTAWALKSFFEYQSLAMTCKEFAE